MQTSTSDPNPVINPAPQLTNQPDLELKKQNKLLKTLIFVLSAIFIIIAVAFGYILLKNGNQAVTNQTTNKIANNGSPQPTITANPTGIPITTPAIVTKAQNSYTEDTGITNQKKFISPKLGISFLYLSKVLGSNETIQVKEVGNKIFVYSSVRKSYEDGQFLEVFTKTPAETLVQAITNQFLVGKDPSRCFVKEGTFSQFYPSSYIAAEITFPDDEEFDLGSMLEKSSYCGADYARTNGQRYFLEDKNHADKFIFLSIGQYGISADSKKVWQDTITFLD